jgi:outer membrane immunogenic protein
MSIERRIAYIFGGTLALLLGLAFTLDAYAADLPSRKAPPVAPAPLPIWTGFYLGVNAGYAFDPNTATLDAYSSGQVDTLVGKKHVYTPYAWNTPGRAVMDTSGFAGGAQAGYNYQIGSLVLGGEFEFVGHAGGRPTVSFATPGLGVVPRVSQIGRSWDWAGTVGPRVGWAVFPALLLYADGGYAFAHTTQSVASYESVITAMNNGVSESRIRSGWFVGGGAEWLFAQNWSIKLDYKYLDFGKQTASFQGVSYGATPTTWSTASFIGHEKVGVHTVKIGLNYHFNLPILPALH